MCAVDALVAQYSATDLVSQLRLATDRCQRERTALLCGALIRIEDDAARVDGAEVVANAISKFPTDKIVVGVALGALSYSWPPPATSTKRVLNIVMEAMARFKTQLLVMQAGVRILKLHSASNQQIVLAPSVMKTVYGAMQSFPHDDMINHWGAQVVSMLNGIEPEEVIRAHGNMNYTAMHVQSIALAITAHRPTTLVLNGTPWHDLILDLHPRLRSQVR
jgi:hypothetical protein